jgi:hypothetical protein
MYVSKVSARRGFIALISIIILSFVLLVAVVSLGQFGLTGRLLLLDIENKTRSEEYAEACVHAARILIVNDPEASRTNVPFSYDDISCTLVSLDPDTPSSGESTIKSKAEVDGATTNFVVVVDAASYDIVSWKEYAVMP